MMATAPQEQLPDLGIIGESEPIVRLRQMIIKFAASPKAEVLILGESGTGKELVARAIHSCSARATKPLVPIDSGALASSMAESELFGHVKGAFTDASYARLGVFREADGGTLFLDECGNMDLKVQQMLLRARWRRSLSGPLGAPVSSKWTSASSRPRTATFQNWCGRDSSAKTCITA
jgi:transcriptional regulator with GAF, ATPase, and Fis domain